MLLTHLYFYRCETKEVDIPECPDEHIAAAKRVEHCGLLNYSTDHSPFRKCIRQIPILADEKLTGCVFDVCATFKDGTIDEQSLGCGYYEEFDKECSLRGFHIKWRTPTICRKHKLYPDIEI